MSKMLAPGVDGRSAITTIDSSAINPALHAVRAELLGAVLGAPDRFQGAWLADVVSRQMELQKMMVTSAGDHNVAGAGYGTPSPLLERLASMGSGFSGAAGGEA